jgi:protein O-GlcNAc transferase
MQPTGDGQNLMAFLLDAANRRLIKGERIGAGVLLDEVLQIAPENVVARLSLAKLRLRDSPSAASFLAQRVVEAAPNDAEGWSVLGQALSALSRGDEAIQAFRQAARLTPDDAHAQSNLSVALSRAGDPHAAVAAAQRAISLDPRLAEAHANLGHSYNILERSEDAVSAFTAALHLRPDFSDALLGLARAYKSRGRPSLGVIALLRAIALAPSESQLHFELATLYQELGEHRLAKDALSRGLKLAGPLSRLESNLLMAEQYDPASSESLAASAARNWGNRCVAATPVSRLERESPAQCGRKIRVGYVSSDLYSHPVGWLGAGPIMAHDHDDFEVVVYANQTCADALTERIRGSVDRWVPILGLDDDAVAARIVADEIDILVDLAGHTGGNRLPVFARRPAPIQVTWLGYFASTGLPTMDYALLDDAHLVDGADTLFSEEIVRLPGCRFCYTAPDHADEPKEAPSARGKPTTFGSFNNAAKINAAVIDLWAQILSETAESELMLKWRSFADPILQARTRAEFEKRGVRGDRIRFDGATPHAEMLKQYAQVDIALDPFPFSGGATSCEALWMGVPVVTLPGSRPVSRQTHSVLRTIGRAEFSASSPSSYVQTATQLARDIDRLTQIRKSLRGEMTNSSICDAKAFARKLEAEFRELVSRCRSWARPATAI